MADPGVGARLQRRFPELSVEPLRLLDEGFGSTVVETADGVIFRIARHARAAAGHARELELLRQLAGRLPAAVPEPRWRIEAGAEFPNGAIGYRKLPGEPVAPYGGTPELAGDFWYENLLTDRGRLVGVLDWGGAAYADPAEDFATVRHLGDTFTEAVFEAYGADESLRHRERRHWELRELYGIGMALELQDDEELADGIRKLRRGAVFTSWRECD